ncbi:hypothetical protein CBR_g49475 [Chara braunii]|uniref:Uncharacterized protein n=1 Tax=Chara braunii TaxID=69332 RepID=A0A388K4X5_CHABU|nr:hypothetical protein CBR_g49475 [Chara braunii]|eukprot:GBG65112.1 hypothetical protein CBR_g49475 [Chara braunii]
MAWTWTLEHQQVVLLGSREETILAKVWEGSVDCPVRLLIHQWAEDELVNAPLKPGLQGSRRQGLLGEPPFSTSLGGGVHKRLEKASGSKSPRRLVDMISDLVRGRKVVESTGIRPGSSEVRQVRGVDETTRSARPAPIQLQTEANPQREAGGNVTSEEELLELGAILQSSPETTQSGGKRNLPVDEVREGVATLKRQRGSGRTPTTQERSSVGKRKKVGGRDDMPKDSSTRRRTGESSRKRSKLMKEKKADEGDTGRGTQRELNLNIFNIDKAFFLEMKTGVQKDVVLHVHPGRILHIPDWEDAYSHRSLDEFFVDTIAAAMIDCYERQDMRYTKPTFILTLIVAPLEKDKPAVCVLPQDFDASHPEKYWYYPVCGQPNVRAAMKVKDDPVFNYNNFKEWSLKPIYFPDDEFDGYAYVSCEDNLKDKKNPPRLQILSMRDIRIIWKIKGRPRVILGNASKKKEEVRKWTQFMGLAMKKTPYTPLWSLST